jgi:hypothetical protein
VTGVEIIARLLETIARTGEPDWYLLRPDFLERLDEVQLDEDRVGTARLWTLSGGRVARMDYYPDFRADEPPWSSPGR